MEATTDSENVKVLMHLRRENKIHNIVKISIYKKTYYAVVESDSPLIILPNKLKFEKVYTNPLHVLDKYTDVANLKTNICNGTNKRVISNESLFYYDKGIVIEDGECLVNLGCRSNPDIFKIAIPTTETGMVVETKSGILHINHFKQDIEIA